MLWCCYIVYCQSQSSWVYIILHAVHIRCWEIRSICVVEYWQIVSFRFPSSSLRLLLVACAPIIFVVIHLGNLWKLQHSSLPPQHLAIRTTQELQDDFICLGGLVDWMTMEIMEIMEIMEHTTENPKHQTSNDGSAATNLLFLDLTWSC